MAILATTVLAGMRAHALPAFSDNYIWLLEADGKAIVLDPGDDLPIISALTARNLALKAILVTHHHPDHVGRLAALAAQSRCPVFGPVDARIPEVTHHVRDGDVITVAGFPDFAVWAVPGHTRSHLAYRTSDAIFVGDTMFAAGCGRVFEGEAAELYRSLVRIGALPGDTQVFCSHEYTRSNLAFAMAVEPGNAAIRTRRDALRDGVPSVPFSLTGEHASNVFLRCTAPTVVQSAERHAGHALVDGEAVFAVLRSWKNHHV